MGSLPSNLRIFLSPLMVHDLEHLMSHSFTSRHCALRIEINTKDVERSGVLKVTEFHIRLAFLSLS